MNFCLQVIYADKRKRVNAREYKTLVKFCDTYDIEFVKDERYLIDEARRKYFEKLGKHIQMFPKVHDAIAVLQNPKFNLETFRKRVEAKELEDNAKRDQTEMNMSRK